MTLLQLLFCSCQHKRRRATCERLLTRQLLLLSLRDSRVAAEHPSQGPGPARRVCNRPGQGRPGVNQCLQQSAHSLAEHPHTIFPLVQTDMQLSLSLSLSIARGHTLLLTYLNAAASVPPSLHATTGAAHQYTGGTMDSSRALSIPIFYWIPTKNKYCITLDFENL